MTRRKNVHPTDFGFEKCSYPNCKNFYNPRITKTYYCTLHKKRKKDENNKDD